MIKKIPNLTAIRFILATLVILFHTPQFFKNRGFPYFNDLTIFHKGTEAVYVFFSLSGFLIIKQLYIEKKQTHSINLKRFYHKRILRIFPLYYLILIFGFLYYRTILPYFGFEVENNYNPLSGIVLSVTFFSNIFKTYSPGGILEVLWSIGIEEQFYLFIAPALLIIPFKRIVLFLGVFSGIYLLMCFYKPFNFLRDYSMFFFYFSFGGLCAIIKEKDFVARFLKKIRYVVFLVFIIYFTTSFIKVNLNDFAYHLISVLTFGLFLSCLAIKPIAFLENKIMDYLGKISYGIYMYHTIAIQITGFLYLKFLSKFNFSNTFVVVLTFVLVLSFTLLMAHFSYKYYESYFLKLKTKYKNV